MRPNRKKCESVRHSKGMDIGKPSDFQHVCHISIDSELSLSGVPPQWRRFLARSGSVQSVASIGFNAIQCQYKPIPTREELRRSRVSSTSEKDKKFEDLVNPSIMHKVLREDPTPLFEKLAIKEDKGFGNIFYGYKKNNFDLLAIKYVKLNQTSDIERLVRELEFHNTHQHANIVQFVESYYWEGCLWMLFKDYEDIQLSQIIKKIYLNISSLINEKRMQIDHLVYIAHSILQGLDYVHSKNYIHRDIKSDNILVSSTGIVRISDFSICIALDKQLVSGGVCGSPYWMAPEVITKKSYGREADIWSYGCVIIEMMDGDPPLYHVEPQEVLEELKKVDIESLLPKSISCFGPFARPFLDCCLNMHRTSRASASQLLMHPFLSKKCAPQDLAALARSVSLV